MDASRLPSEAAAAISTRLELRFGYATDTGPRERNEDYAAFYAGSREQQARLGAVAAIADGVGGAKGGREAAELAVRSFIDGHLGQNETLGIQHNSARTVEAFNSWAHSIGRSDEKLAGMACTLTVLVLRGRQVHVIHVGDTRAYRWRDGRLAAANARSLRSAGGRPMTSTTSAVALSPARAAMPASTSSRAVSSGALRRARISAICRFGTPPWMPSLHRR